jgi:SAM-dependent methyltransferase
MTEPILNPLYWKERLQEGLKTHLHWSVYKVGVQHWKEAEEAHKGILRRRVREGESILDVGCGYGRLLSLLSGDYRKYYYVGVDLSPDFIELAKKTYPEMESRFIVKPILEVLDDMHDYTNPDHAFKFDWGILISFRPMIIRYLGADYWNTIHEGLKKNCKKLLFLEYDPEDPERIEECETLIK